MPVPASLLDAPEIFCPSAWSTHADRQRQCSQLRDLDRPPFQHQERTSGRERRKRTHELGEVVDRLTGILGRVEDKDCGGTSSAEQQADGQRADRRDRQSRGDSCSPMPRWQSSLVDEWICEAERDRKCQLTRGLQSKTRRARVSKRGVPTHWVSELATVYPTVPPP